MQFVSGSLVVSSEGENIRVSMGDDRVAILTREEAKQLAGGMLGYIGGFDAAREKFQVRVTVSSYPTF